MAKIDSIQLDGSVMEQKVLEISIKVSKVWIWRLRGAVWLMKLAGALIGTRAVIIECEFVDKEQR